MIGRVTLALCGRGGRSIRDAAQEAVDLVRGHSRIFLIFNDLAVSVTEESTVESICAEYGRKEDAAYFPKGR